MSSAIPKEVSATIDGDLQFTDWISPSYKNASGEIQGSVLMDSAWDGVVALQRRNILATDTTPKLVQTYATDDEIQLNDTTPGEQYRIGTPNTGDVVSGSCEVRLVK